MRTLPLLLLAAFGLGAGPAVGGDRALVIGIGAYEHQTPLPGPPHDARAMRRVAVEQLGFAPAEVMAILDGDATRETVLAAFETWLVAGTEPGDRVLLYYAGHGSQIADRNGDEAADGLDEVLVMVDAAGPDPGGVISDDEIAALLDRLADRRVTVVIDACHSGTIARSESAARARYVTLGAASRSAATPRAERADTGLRDLPSGNRQHAIWSAAAASQPAWEERVGETSRGVFTRAFIEALSDRSADGNNNGRVSRQETLAFLQARSDDFCERAGVCAAGLTPELAVPPAARALAVVAWPEATGPAAGAAPDAPVTAVPDMAAMLDLITGGVRDVRLGLHHAAPDRTGPVRTGDAVAFEITSPRAGDLLLFDLRDGGLAHQLFPSTAIAKSTSLAPGRALRLPDAYHGTRFSLPPGAGTLVALVVHDRGLVARLARQNASMRPIADPLAFFGALMAELNGVHVGETANRKVSFGMATLPYRAH